MAGLAVPSALPAAATTPPTRYVDVSVATLWTRPGTARAVDAPALSNPAHPRQWVSSMTVAQKRWLNGKIDTQALYGTRVRVLATRGSWTKVAVPTQSSPKSSWGYPGWVPTRQLTTRTPAPATTTAVVTARTAWLWRSPGTVGTTTGRVTELSYDTRLPVVSATSAYVRVAMLGGSVVRTLRRSDVTLHRSGTAWSPTGRKAVAQASKFLGLPYLWAGTAGFGYDCSGLTYSAYRVAGVQLARDASVQFRHGRAVAKSALRPGDLVFFKDSSGAVVHVAMYYGLRNGVRTVIESPRTGAAVRLTRLSAWTWQYVGARRYVTP
ncbi:MAG: C40 family peptidase [Actinomycetes bacterium]